MSIRDTRRKRRAKPLIPQLNLTSMIDVFTILLIFLLKSYSASVIDIARDLILPESVMNKQPVPTVIVAVTQSDILVEDKPVLSLDDVNWEKETLMIEPLFQYLMNERDNILDTHLEGGFTGNIIVEADKNIEYGLLKRVMHTCGQAEFNDISLAVLTKEE
jgi:biopolymer transport protein ExbD